MVTERGAAPQIDHQYFFSFVVIERTDDGFDQFVRVERTEIRHGNGVAPLKG
jgi:hypothetical protein